VADDLAVGDEVRRERRGHAGDPADPRPVQARADERDERAGAGHRQRRQRARRAVAVRQQRADAGDVLGHRRVLEVPAPGLLGAVELEEVLHVVAPGRPGDVLVEGLAGGAEIVQAHHQRQREHRADGDGPRRRRAAPAMPQVVGAERGQDQPDEERDQAVDRRGAGALGELGLLGRRRRQRRVGHVLDLAAPAGRQPHQAGVGAGGQPDGGDAGREDDPGRVAARRIDGAEPVDGVTADGQAKAAARPHAEEVRPAARQVDRAGPHQRAGRVTRRRWRQRQLGQRRRHHPVAKDHRQQDGDERERDRGDGDHHPARHQLSQGTRPGHCSALSFLARNV
jgi:hypothetical protein